MPFNEELALRIKAKVPHHGYEYDPYKKRWRFVGLKKFKDIMVHHFVMPDGKWRQETVCATVNELHRSEELPDYWTPDGPDSGSSDSDASSSSSGSGATSQHASSAKPAVPPFQSTAAVSNASTFEPTSSQFKFAKAPDINFGLRSKKPAAQSGPSSGILVSKDLNEGKTQTKPTLFSANQSQLRKQAATDDAALPIPSLDEHLSLLSLDSLDSYEDVELSQTDILSCPLFSVDTLREHGDVLEQYALLGSSVHAAEVANDPRLFVNVTHPFSAFICGLQGSGKSHSTSCLIENCLLPSPVLGSLKSPLSALVFHYSEYTSSLAFRPCEVAYLGQPHPEFRALHRPIPVTVLVSPSNYLRLKSAYEKIPSVTVRKLRLDPKDLNISTLLTLMSVTDSDTVPLYMSQLTKILREMAEKSETFSYHTFKRRVSALDLTPMQRQPLQQRLDLLESFLDLSTSSQPLSFPDGSITIVDLSCPFVDANTACVLFNITLDLYLSNATTGRQLVAVDEAHKYMTGTPASKVLTDSLISAIRMQRHYGVRIIIATQEPTVEARLMDLCSMTVIHRFTSPEWFKVLGRHVSVGKAEKELYERIMALRTGEALVFAAGGIVGGKRLGSEAVKVKVRKRVTWDGGKSILSTQEDTS